jgi:hypothetical protein
MVHFIIGHVSRVVKLVQHYAVRLMYLVKKLWQLSAHIFRQHMKRQLYHTLAILTEACMNLNC